MQDDIIGALTQEVKEEVIWRYLYDRKLIEEQINYVNELAEHAAELEGRGTKHFTQICDTLAEPKFINEFTKTVGLQDAPLTAGIDKDRSDSDGLVCVRVRGFTHRARFKRFVIESYSGLYTWNSQYKEAYENLEEECKAVSHNLKKFENNYDLLTLLNFLKDIDLESLEKKQWLGDNFTPAEMGSIEASLAFKPVRMEQFKLQPPPNLPEPKSIQKQLNDLAGYVYGQCSERIKTLVK
ncbi:MAG: hypothetical protein JRJ47_00055 [Deltaproteobacteria bacterium]|nr:hypothetical protein [Deltaproteobacteria bacterium]